MIWLVLLFIFAIWMIHREFNKRDSRINDLHHSLNALKQYVGLTPELERMQDEMKVDLELTKHFTKTNGD